MIFPLLRGFCPWNLSPVTWALVALNAIMLIVTAGLGADAQRTLDRALDDSFFVSTQGRLYAYHLEEGAADTITTPLLLRLGMRAREDSAGAAGAREALGQLAFRDNQFLDDVKETVPGVDPVAFEYWRATNFKLRELKTIHPSFNLGLNEQNFGATHWVTYMFIHSGFLHFAGNMLFLAIFGGALEAQIGGLAFLVTYLLFGICAAGSFALASGMTSSPLVGASGAVSGTVALYVALNWRRPCRYFFWWLIPLPEYMGFIYLPSWVVLALALAADLAGYLSTPVELGGIANTAHLGGTFAGLLAGFAVVSWRNRARLSLSPQKWALSIHN